MNKIVYFILFLFFFCAATDRHFAQQKNQKKESPGSRIESEGLSLSRNLKWGKFEKSAARESLVKAKNLTENRAALLGYALGKEDLNIDDLVKRNEIIKERARIKEFDGYLVKYRSAKNEFEKRRLAGSEKAAFESLCNEMEKYSEQNLFILQMNCKFDEYSFSEKKYPVSYQEPYNRFFSYLIKMKSSPALLPSEIKMSESDAERLSDKLQTTYQRNGAYGLSVEQVPYRGAKIILLLKVVNGIKFSFDSFLQPEYPGVLFEPVYSIFIAPVTNEIIAIFDEKDAAKYEAIKNVREAAKKLIEGNPIRKAKNAASFMLAEGENENSFNNAVTFAKNIGDSDITKEVYKITTEVEAFRIKNLNQMMAAVKSGNTFNGIISSENEMLLSFAKESKNPDAIIPCFILKDFFFKTYKMNYTARWKIKEGIARCYITSNNPEEMGNYLMVFDVNELNESLFSGFAPKISSCIEFKMTSSKVSDPELMQNVYAGFDREIKYYTYTNSWVYREITINGKNQVKHPWLGKTIKEVLKMLGANEEQSNGYTVMVDKLDMDVLDWSESRIKYSKKQSDGSVAEFLIVHQ